MPLTCIKSKSNNSASCHTGVSDTTHSTLIDFLCVYTGYLCKLPGGAISVALVCKCPLVLTQQYICHGLYLKGLPLGFISYKELSFTKLHIPERIKERQNFPPKNIIFRKTLNCLRFFFLNIILNIHDCNVEENWLWVQVLVGQQLLKSCLGAPYRDIIFYLFYIVYIITLTKPLIYDAPSDAVTN